MFRSSFARCLPILLALSATTLAVPRPQGWNGGSGVNPWLHTVVVTTIIEGSAPTSMVAPVSSSPVAVEPSSSSSSSLVPVQTQSATPISTASTAPSATPSSGTTNDGGKRGLAYNSSSPDLNIFNSYSDIGWGLDWSSARAQLPSKYMFVPQLWSDAPDHTGTWINDVNSANPSYVLSFNEPDITSQAHMPVSQAVSSHVQWMNPRANGGAVKIGSVSVSNGVKASPSDSPMGLEYLGDFLTQCSQATPAPCIVDFASVHWYGCTNSCGVDADLAAFKTDMSNAITTANGLDVWITEFQHFGSEQDQQSFVSQALTWLDEPAQSKIVKYAYFMVLDGIMTSGGSLNTVGTTFASQ